MLDILRSQTLGLNLSMAAATRQTIIVEDQETTYSTAGRKRTPWRHSEEVLEKRSLTSTGELVKYSLRNLSDSKIEKLVKLVDNL